MNYKNILQQLEKKDSTEACTEQEIRWFMRISKTKDYGKRYWLLEIIQEQNREEQFRDLIKEMADDRSPVVYKMAMQVLNEVGTEEDYDFLLDLAARTGNDEKRFYALYYLYHLLYDLDLDEDKFLSDVNHISEMCTERYTQFICQVCRFFGTWDTDILRSLEKYLYDSSFFIRLWTINVLEDLMDLLEEGDEEAYIVREMLEQKVLRKDKIRKIRIRADRAHARLCKEIFQEEYCERDFKEEYDLEEKLSSKICNQPNAEEVLTYCILLFYHPFGDIVKAVDILKKYYRKFDFRLAFLGGWYMCYYKFEEKNIFLDYLFEHEGELTREERSLMYMLKGTKLCLKEQMEIGRSYLKEAMEEDSSYANIYKECLNFGVYPHEGKKMQREFRKRQRILSLTELENMDLRERCSYAFFKEMEIKKNKRKPDNYEY